MKSLIILFFAALGLAGCVSRPPACGEEQAVDSVKNLIVQEVQKVLKDGTEYKSDPAPIDAFFKNLKISLSMITTDGYDEKSKKHVCHGKLVVSIADQVGNFDIDYSTQNMEDKRGDFVVEIAQGQTIIDKTTATGFYFWNAQRFSGAWKGVYSCDAIDGEETGSRAAFQQDVTLTVANSGQAKLERTTRGGGTEALQGDIDATGRLKISGTGRNSPDDKWKISFNGEVESGSLAATGAITDFSGDQRLRTCQLKLHRVPDEAKVL